MTNVGSSILYTVVPVVSTTPAYTANDSVGGLQTLTDVLRMAGSHAILESLMLTDAGNQKAALEILLFSSLPTIAADNAAFTVSAADLANVVARVPVATTDYVTIDTKAYANIKGIGALVRGTGTLLGKTLYAGVFTTGTPTYTGAGNLTFKYGFLRD